MCGIFCDMVIFSRIKAKRTNTTYLWNMFVDIYTHLFINRLNYTALKGVFQCYANTEVVT